MNKTSKNYFIPIYLIISFGILVIFFILPIILSIYYSFTNLSLYNLNRFSFTGISNYIGLFTSSAFYHSLEITLIFLLVSAIIGQAFLGLVISAVLNSVNKTFRAIIATSILLAWSTPQVTGGILWYTTLSSTPPGVVPIILSRLGLHSIDFLGKHFALYSIIVANVWLGLAFSVLIFLAGIQNINPSVVKASIVDGVGPVRRFFTITIPLLKNSILMDLIMITLFTFGTFTLIYTFTGGGPAGTTQILTIYQYYTAFSFFDVGLGSAIGVVIIAMAVALSLIYLRVVKVE